MLKQYYRRNRNGNLNTDSYYTLNWQITDINNSCVVQSFGTTQDSLSVYTEFTGFYPFFYVKIEKVKSVPISNFLSKFPEYILKQSDFIKERCTVEQRKDFYGYHPNNETFVKLSFKSIKAFEAAKKHLYSKTFFGGYTIKTYEANIKQILRFFHQYTIVPCGLLTMDNYIDISDTINTTCNINRRCHVSNITKSEQSLKSIPYITASFDIETYSDNDNFPNADFEKDVITHISTTFSINGAKEPLCQITFSLSSNEFETKKNQHHICLESEKELILQFQKMIINLDPDIIYSYNGDIFDWQYVFKRAKRCKIPLQIGKIRDIKCDLKTPKFNSSAFGDNVYQRLECKGRFLFDILIYIKRQYKEVSYKLDDIAKKYLGHSKNDVTVQEMFESYRNVDLQLSKKIAEYCQQDALLPLQLVEKLHMIQVLIGMANVCCVPIELLIFEGEQVKACSQILRAAAQENYCIPTKTNSEKIDFVGATVLEPLTGFYQTPVTVVDFKSLYPSIIRAHNLCYSTYASSQASQEADATTFEWQDTSGTHNYTFVNETTRKGIIPGLLKTLGESREASKKLRSQFKKTDFEYIVYDKLQNAYKLSMNSIYGFLSAYQLTCTPIAATVTRVGRVMLEKTADYITKQYGDRCQVIYGDTDSVFYNNKKGNLKDAMALGPIIAAEVSKLFKDPIELEFEKVYDPLLLFKKKRYCGALYTKVSNTYDYLDTKGVQTERRDNCRLLRTIYGKLLEFIMKKEPEKCLDYLKTSIQKLRQGELMEELIISKAIKNTYKNNNLPHVVVANLRRQRGEQISSNQRIEYIFKVTGENFREPQYKKAEDPKYVVENNIPIDYDYYILKQLKNPIVDMLGLIFDEALVLDCFKDPNEKVQTKLNFKKIN